MGADTSNGEHYYSAAVWHTKPSSTEAAIQPPQPLRVSGGFRCQADNISSRSYTPPFDTPSLTPAASSSPFSYHHTSPFSASDRRYSSDSFGSSRRHSSPWTNSSIAQSSPSRDSGLYRPYLDRQSTDIEDIPPLTSDASEYSDVELHESEDEVPHPQSIKSVRRKSSLEDNDILLAAQALLLFSDPMHAAPAPSPAFNTSDSKLSLSHLLCKEDLPPTQIYNRVAPLPTRPFLPTFKPLSGPPSPSLVESALAPNIETSVLKTEPQDEEASVDLAVRPATPGLKRVMELSPSVPGSPSRRPRKRCRQDTSTKASDRESSPGTPLPEPEVCGKAMNVMEESSDQNIVVESVAEPIAEASAPSSPPSERLMLEASHSLLTPQESPSSPAPEVKPSLEASVESSSENIKVASPAQEEVDEEQEVEGLIISALALSRASSMTVPAIVRNMLGSQPRLQMRRSKKEWEKNVRLALEKKTDANSMFERIKRTGTDAASHKLEDQYFYVPENDHDQSRAELLVGLMPKKRGVTKQHHQYYFKPVPKVVEWDHEDEFN